MSLSLDSQQFAWIIRIQDELTHYDNWDWKSLKNQLQLLGLSDKQHFERIVLTGIDSPKNWDWIDSKMDFRKISTLSDLETIGLK